MTGHAETQVLRLHYKLTMQSNGITAIGALGEGVAESAELTGDRRQNEIKVLTLEQAVNLQPAFK